MHEALLAEEAFDEPAGIIERLSGAVSAHLDKGQQIDDGLVLAVAKD
jgi:hypothetical protein